MNFKTLIALVVVLAISTLSDAKQALFVDKKAVKDSFGPDANGNFIHKGTN